MITRSRSLAGRTAILTIKKGTDGNILNMKTDLVVAGYVLHGGKVLLIRHKKLGIWLPPGGHIERDETPDDALRREISEELGLKVRLLNHSDLLEEGNVKRNLAIPFYANVHSVGDHDHCCFFYVCEALNPGDIKCNMDELLGYDWFSADELKRDQRISADVKHQALRVLRQHNPRLLD